MNLPLPSELLNTYLAFADTLEPGTMWLMSTLGLAAFGAGLGTYLWRAWKLAAWFVPMLTAMFSFAQVWYGVIMGDIRTLWLMPHLLLLGGLWAAVGYKKLMQAASAE